MARHPHKEINAAVDHAIDLGWTLISSSGHAWGIIRCPDGTRDGCRRSVWSTPKNPEKFARELRRYVDKCPHVPEEP
jgi:hypothetical protein